jgi:hypothetical protein
MKIVYNKFFFFFCLTQDNKWVAYQAQAVYFNKLADSVWQIMKIQLNS